MKYQIERGDIIENGELLAVVLDTNCKNNTIKVSIKGSKLLISKDWLNDWDIANPIKNNRLVSDKTFAIRLKNFVENVRVNDPCSEDEQKYLLKIANRLLRYQIETVSDKEEINYLERLNLFIRDKK